MTCPNFNVKIVKVHDTKFWCCEQYRTGKYLDLERKLGYKFCPYCGSKLR